MFEIVYLPKEQYKGTPVPLDYRNDSYYDLEISPLNENGCTVSLVRKPREVFEANHHDTLYQDYWEAPEAYGVVDEQGKMLACIEVTRKSGQTASWLPNSGYRRNFAAKASESA